MRMVTKCQVLRTRGLKFKIGKWGVRRGTNLAVTLGTTLSETLATLSTARHVVKL